jgi:HK97 family phage major capsid protein/HK97 family phage prohead protease
MRYVEKSAPPPGGEPDEFVMSDDTVDRMGDVIDPGGWQLSSIKTAPPVLFNHNKDEIVGRWENIRISGNQLIGRIVWADFKNWPKGQYIRDLVRGGFLRTVSVGFRPLARQPLTKDANKDFGPFRFTKSEVLECSLVSVPANPNAIALAKSLHLSDEIVTEVFGESARSFVASTGKPAIVTPVRKSTPMSNATTIANKIQTAQQTLNVLLANYEELVGKTELTDDEVKRYREELPRQIDDARAELASHQHAERTLFGNGSGNGADIPQLPRVADEPIMAPAIVKSREPVISEPSRLPTIIPRKKLEASDHQIRALAAWTKSQAAHDPDIGRTLRDMYRGGPGSEITDMVLRAAVNPANTTVATWAAELVQTDVQPFLDRLIAESIYLPLASMGVRYTFTNAGVLKIPVRANSPTLAGNWVAESAPKPVRRASFTTVTLSPTKMAVISTFSEEMSLYSAQSIEQIIRQAMSDDTQMALDAYLIDAVAASAGVRPAGLLNGVTPITASVATPASAAMVADLKALIGAIIAAGGGRNVALIINPAQQLSLGTATTSTGDFLFTDAGQAASKFGFSRLIVSASCPAGRVIAVDAADFATAQGDAPRFAVSTDATLHEEDTTPLALSATGSPNTVAAPMRSLFQTDAVAIRMSMFVTWAMRRAGMVQTIAAVTW